MTSHWPPRPGDRVYQQQSIAQSRLRVHQRHVVCTTEGITENEMRIEHWKCKDGSNATSIFLDDIKRCIHFGGYIVSITSETQWLSHVTKDCFSSDEERVKMVKMFYGECNA